MTHYHFIGIGGAGLSPIARILFEKGHYISGSDMNLSPSAQRLQELGVKVYLGHNASNIKGANVIIRSSAIQDSNAAAGIAVGIPVIKRSDFLADLTAGKKVIAVAGTHGKTTTTAMIAWVLTQCGLDPTYLIGGISKNLNSNAHAGGGEYFVIEADEYDGMFLGLKPDFLVITVVEHDHPDFYPTVKSYFDAFFALTRLIKPGGYLIADMDNSGSRKVMDNAPKNTNQFYYGTTAQADYVIDQIQHKPGCGVCFAIFSAAHGGESQISEIFNLPIPGNHNAHNAAAAIALAQLIGLPLDKIKAALESFIGTGRRYDVKSIANEITIIDDYAHHPTEIRATLSAARCQFPNQQIWVVWQPHTYSRTRELIEDFKNAFIDCDHVIVTEIFASREKKQDYSSREVIKLINHKDVRLISDLKNTSDFLVKHLVPGDVLLVLSAGDADQVSKDVINALGGNKGATK